MRRALIVASVPSMIGQFNMHNAALLMEMGCEVHVACNLSDRSVWTQERVDAFKHELDQKGICFHQVGFSRSPTELGALLRSYRELESLCEEIPFDIIHCHTPIAGMISRLVAHRRHISVIYTAHGFHFYKGAPRMNWLLYYPVEWVCAHWTDILITINEEDYAFARRHMRAKRVEHVPGVGIDLAAFSPDALPPAVKAEKRNELGLADGEKMLLSVGELNRNKNHEIVLRALAQIDDKTIHYVIAGQGELKEYLAQTALALGLENRVHLLGFRKDVAQLYRAADLYIHPSLREGLPVALTEAAASGTLAAASDVRGNRDVIKTKELLFDPRSGTQLADVIRMALSFSPEERTHVIEENYAGLLPRSIEAVNDAMAALYRSV